MDTPKTERILGFVATLFRDGDKPVYLLPDGRFAAHWQGKWLVKPNLKSLDKVLGGVKPYLKLFKPDRSYGAFGHDFSLRVLDVTEMSKGKVYDRDGKRHHSSYGSWYEYDPVKVAQLKDLVERYEKSQDEFRAEYDAIMVDTVAVSQYDFKEVLKERTETLKPEEAPPDVSKTPARPGRARKAPRR